MADHYPHGPCGHWRAAHGACVLAAAYLLAALWAPVLVPAVCAAAAVSAPALVLARRSSRRLVRTLLAVAVLVLVGLAGAALLAEEREGGVLWLVVAGFLAPLPVVPWLYACSFEEEDR
ncbi:MAG: hypothetical protein HXY19_04935 [Thermoanaerobaculaceae bacterium]|nr:hypothetical protein [Thermoanaerobaculaceae bacterium]